MLLFKGSSTMVIQPCYDGQKLSGIQELAGDGLSVLSIKEAHQECKMIKDPHSKVSVPTCTQGFKARNSFRNLHKPDLRRIKGLECTTVDSVTRLFETHNAEASVFKTYTKKMMRLIGGLVPYKSKSIDAPEVLIRNFSWNINTCVLSSICQEKELTESRTAVTKSQPIIKEFLREEEIENKGSLENCSSAISNATEKSKESDRNLNKDDVLVTLPPKKMHENISHDFIHVDDLPNASNGDSSTKTSQPLQSTPIRLGYDSSCDASTSFQVMSSSIVLENKPSLYQFSIPSTIKFDDKIDFLGDNYTTRQTVENHEGLGYGNRTKKHIEDNIYDEKIDIKKAVSDLEVEEKSSSQVVKSIFSDIFEEMQEIDNVISSYISSFYVLEEEYNNYPAHQRSSKEVVSHFFEQMHGPHRSRKSENCDTENKHTPSLSKNKCNLVQDLEEGRNIDNASEFLDKEENKILNNRSEENTQVLKSINEHSFSKEGVPETRGYCYWEEDLLSGDDMSTTNHLKQTISDIEITKRNTDLLPLNFIETMWQEFRTNVETHAMFLDLVNQNEMKKNMEAETPFPNYGHWATMYDQNIQAEAETIVHTLDNLFMGGCFSANDGQRSFIPCTIVELVDDNELSWGTAHQDSVNDCSNLNEEKYNSSEYQEAQLITPNIKTDHIIDRFSDVNGLNDSQVLDDQQIYHCITLETVPNYQATIYDPNHSVQVEDDNFTPQKIKFYNYEEFADFSETLEVNKINDPQNFDDQHIYHYITLETVPNYQATIYNANNSYLGEHDVFKSQEMRYDDISNKGANFTETSEIYEINDSQGFDDQQLYHCITLETVPNHQVTIYNLNHSSQGKDDVFTSQEMKYDNISNKCANFTETSEINEINDSQGFDDQQLYHCITVETVPNHQVTIYNLNHSSQGKDDVFTSQEMKYHDISNKDADFTISSEINEINDSQGFDDQQLYHCITLDTVPNHQATIYNLNHSSQGKDYVFTSQEMKYNDISNKGADFTVSTEINEINDSQGFDDQKLYHCITLETVPNHQVTINNPNHSFQNANGPFTSQRIKFDEVRNQEGITCLVSGTSPSKPFIINNEVLAGRNIFQDKTLLSMKNNEGSNEIISDNKIYHEIMLEPILYQRVTTEETENLYNFENDCPPHQGTKIEQTNSENIYFLKQTTLDFNTDFSVCEENTDISRCDNVANPSINNQRNQLDVFNNHDFNSNISLEPTFYQGIIINEIQNSLDNGIIWSDNQNTELEKVNGHENDILLEQNTNFSKVPSEYENQKTYEQLLKYEKLTDFTERSLSDDQDNAYYDHGQIKNSSTLQSGSNVEELTESNDLNDIIITSPEYQEIINDLIDYHESITIFPQYQNIKDELIHQESLRSNAVPGTCLISSENNMGQKKGSLKNIIYKITINDQNYHEINLEPILYQERIEVNNNTDYTRMPENNLHVYQDVRESVKNEEKASIFTKRIDQDSEYDNTVFQRIPQQNDNTSDPTYLFSSPNIKLNLTKPM